MELDIKVNSLSRRMGSLSGRIWRERCFLGKLKREAIKTRVNPSFGDSNVETNYSMKQGNIVLDFNYENSVDALKAYEHARAYEILTRDMGSNRIWSDSEIKISSPEKLNFGKGSWTLNVVGEGQYSDKIRMFVGVKGFINRDAGVNFEEVKKSGGCVYESLSYNSEPVLSSPLVYLASSFDNLNSLDFSKKIKHAEEWLQPYWEIRHLPWGPVGNEGLVGIAYETFIEKKNPRKVNNVIVEVPLGEFGGSKVVAKYKEDFKD